MIIDPKNECKLMILYLLSKVDFPINQENLNSFFLDNYTTFFNFQNILDEMLETDLIKEYRTNAYIHYEIAKDGLDTLNAFYHDISIAHIEEIDKYLKINKIKIKEDSIIKATYEDKTSGNYKVLLEIADNTKDNFKLEIDVPSKEVAISICANWRNKANNIYTYLIKQLINN